MFSLVTNTINTGVSAASVIEIVDQNKGQTTWYVYNAGNPADYPSQRLSRRGVTTLGMLFGRRTLASSEANSGIPYSPQSNLLYQWVYTADLSRTDAGGNNADPRRTAGRSIRRMCPRARPIIRLH